MFETNVAVVGTVLTEPREHEFGGNRFVRFLVASNSRRLDSATGRWIDGDRLVAAVNCRRRLADGVRGVIGKTAPVVVSGRLRTRDYEQHGQWRTAVEIEAAAVGLDLARSDRFSPPGECAPGPEPGRNGRDHRIGSGLGEVAAARSG